MHEFLFGYYMLFIFCHLTRSEIIQNEFVSLFTICFSTVYYLFQLSNFHDFIISSNCMLTILESWNFGIYLRVMF